MYKYVKIFGKIFLIFFLLGILSNLVLALSCDYQDTKELDLTGINIYETKSIGELSLSQAIEITTGKLIINIKGNLNNGRTILCRLRKENKEVKPVRRLF